MGTREFAFEAPIGFDVDASIEGFAQLGGATVRWVEPVGWLEGDTSRLHGWHWQPAEALWMDPLADSYLTDIHLRIVMRNDGGRVVGRVDLPPLLMGWPNGRDGVPVLWTHEEAAVEVPFGAFLDRLPPATQEWLRTQRVPMRVLAPIPGPEPDTLADDLLLGDGQQADVLSVSDGDGAESGVDVAP